MRSDLELLGAWRTGDRVAAGELFDRHAASIYRFFANKVDRDIEDLVQATLMGCVKGRDRIKDGAHFRAYLFGTARNVLRTYLHKRGRLPGHVDLALSSVHDLGLGPSKVVANREEQRLLLEALRSVPVESQLLLELRYWEDLPIDQLAIVFGVAPGTIKSRLSRARARLRGCLEKLSRSQKILENTLTDLDGWATGLKAQVSQILQSR